MTQEFDVIVVGGSYAGLSAAMILARARRRVCVIDTGLPRNRFASASHGFFGFDGSTPATMIAQARAQVAAYATVTFVQGEAVTARQDGPDHFTVTLANGESHTASRLILAHGMRDVLPDIPGLQERWGQTVLHCPYCHGYEIAGERLGVLRTQAGSLHQAQLIPEWGPTTYFLNGHDELDEAAREALRGKGVTLELAEVVALECDAPAITGVRLADGRLVDVDALFLAPTSQMPALAVQLGCEMADGPFGPYISTEKMKMTTVPGVFAAGDAALAMNASIAAADGVMAGAAAHQSLVFPRTA